MPSFDSLLMRTLLAAVLSLLTAGLAWGIRPVINAVLSRLLPRYSNGGATVLQILIILGGLTLATISTSIEAVALGVTPIVTFTLGLVVGGRRNGAGSVSPQQRDNAIQENAVHNNAVHNNAVHNNAVTDDAVKPTVSPVAMKEIASAAERQPAHGYDENRSFDHAENTDAHSAQNVAQREPNMSHVVAGNVTDPPTEIMPIASQTDDEEPAAVAQLPSEHTESLTEHDPAWRSTLPNRAAAPLMKRTSLGKRTIQELV